MSNLKKNMYKIFSLFLFLLILIVSSTPSNSEGAYSYDLAGSNLNNYTEYIVKKGDTLSNIAEELKIDLSTLAKINNIRNIDYIYPGQKLIIDLQASGNKNELNPEREDKQGDDSSLRDLPNNRALRGMDGDLISLDFRNADTRDILSAFARYLGSQILLLEEPGPTDFNIRDVTPRRALELFLQMQGYSYIEDGGLIIVGKADKLLNEFNNHMTITKFDLSYLTSDILEPLIGKSGIPVKLITLEKNRKSIWVQGPAESVSKIKELINLLDKKENAASPSGLRGVKLKNTTADKLSPILAELGIPIRVITLPGIEGTLWIQGTEEDMKNALSLISSLDIAETIHDEYTLFLYELRNITATYAAERLEYFNFENISIISFNYEEFGENLLILSPKGIKNKVLAALEGLDLRGLGANLNEIMIPVFSVDGEYAYEFLRRRRQLLISLIDELKDDESMIKVSEDILTKDGEEYRVLLVKSNVEILKKVREMLDLIQEP